MTMASWVGCLAVSLLIFFGMFCAVSYAEVFDFQAAIRLGHFDVMNFIVVIVQDITTISPSARIAPLQSALSFPGIHRIYRGYSVLLLRLHLPICLPVLLDQHPAHKPQWQ